MGRKRGKKRARYGSRLDLLVEFLNLDVDSAQHASSELRALIRYNLDSPENLKALQSELLEVLLPIAKPPAGFGREKMQAHLISLCDRIHRLRLEIRFIPLSGSPKLFGRHNPARQLISREQRVFAAAGGQWIVKPEFSVGLGLGRGESKKLLYTILADGLIFGDLAMIRLCDYCRTFFVAKELRQIFCTPAHGRLYWDDPARAKKRVEKSRSDES
jgi:hypothetical protein